MKIKFLFLMTIFVITNTFGKQIAVDTKIKVFELPLGTSLNLTNQDLESLENKVPQSINSIKGTFTNTGTVNNKDIIVYFKNNNSQKKNFEILLNTVITYANENLKNINVERLKKYLELVRTSNMTATSNVNIEKIRIDKINNTISQSIIDFEKMTLKEVLKYFIDNYFSININEQPNNDIRKMLVNSIKEKIRKTQNTFINVDSIKYNIGLIELKKIYSII